jgi:hypothetical protein
VGSKLTAALPMLGITPEAVARLPELSAEDAAKITGVLNSVRELQWKIIKRGFWTNGATAIQGFLAAIMKWKLDTRLARRHPAHHGFVSAGSGRRRVRGCGGGRARRGGRRW